MKDDSAHKNRWQIAEVVFGIPFLVGIALHFIVPISLPQGIPRQLLIPVGIILILAGIALVAAARREFAHFRQPTDPGHPTTQVVKTGAFAISRNPLYLGAACVLLGIALALNVPWALLMLVLSIILCHYVLIFPEEHYLAAKFGDEYQEYTDSVHRWLGRR
ncbi:MAG: isoprenylcysteine carboxylmethyltransferase family protein [Bellilinea sp.]|jgi:protein-S-isoprenylcysteine O-methyltransferase Ste14